MSLKHLQLSIYVQSPMLDEVLSQILNNYSTNELLNSPMYRHF